MLSIFLNNKGYKFNIIDTCILILFSFISLSAGTMWGYKYRFWACIFMMFVCFVKILYKGKINFTLEIVPFVFFVGYLLLQVRRSFDGNTTFQYFLIYFSLLLFFLSDSDVILYEKFEKLAEYIILVIAVSVIISVIFPSLIANGFSFVVGSTKVESILRHASEGQYAGLGGELAETACLMNIGIAMVLSRLFNLKFSKMDILKLFLLFGALFLTGKRTLTICALLLVVLCMLLMRGNIRLKLKYLGLIVLFVLILCIMVYSIPSLNVILSRFSGDDYESMNGRDILWYISTLMFNENKLLGMGYGAYNSFSSHIGFTSYGENWTANGHNSYLQCLGEIGIVGTIILFGGIFYWIVKAVVLIFKKNISLSSRKRLMYVICVNVMFLLYCYTGNPLYSIQQIYLWFGSVFCSLYIFERNGDCNEESRNNYLS